MEIRIVVPRDAGGEELTGIIRRAMLAATAAGLTLRVRVGAVMAFAYFDREEAAGAYTAGRGVLASNGRWEDADVGIPASTWLASVELGPAPAL